MKDASFNSRYKYIKKLGSGGCSEVYLAENIKLGSLWAVKEIIKSGDTAVSGYIEPEILKRLNHPALPRICDVWEDDSKIYIIEDYIEGKTMEQELLENGKIDEITVADWGIQLCSVLEYLHSQSPDPIIYGDMKPQNIILTKEGFIKLVDFGISAILKNKDDLQDTGGYASKTSFIGTRGYAAPEQFAGMGISCKSDIYSLGITLIQMITGVNPNQSAICEYISKDYMSPSMAQILGKCIQPNPCSRFESAKSLMNELRNYSLSLKQEKFESYENGTGDARVPTKIIAVIGSAATGVSAITAAMAEYCAKGSSTVCILDLSTSASLEKSLTAKIDSHTRDLQKISRNLQYLSFNDFSSESDMGYSIIHKKLSELQDKFSYIFIDAGLIMLKHIMQYSNLIFIVSDMNPFNFSGIAGCLRTDAAAKEIISRKYFIINKFYKGELSSRSILHSVLLNKDVSQELEELISYSRVFEVPYEEKVYFGQMYSYFGEPVRLKKLHGTCFWDAIADIVSSTILLPKRKASLLKGLGFK